MLRLLFLLAAGSLAYTNAAVTVKDCSSGTSFFKVQSVSFSPDVPVAGQNGTLHSVYEVPMEVKAGTTKYSCSLNGLPVYSETFDLCSQTACPITGGVHDDFSTSAIPSTSGKVSCTIDWRDTAGSQLLCIQTIMTLRSVRNVTRDGKKALRGSVLQEVPAFHFHTLLGTNLSANATCPLIQEYDPSLANYEVLDTSTSASDTESDSGDHKVKKALMVLRSYNKYI